MNATCGERRVPDDRNGPACASGACLCEDDGWEGALSDRSHQGNNGSAS
jgi:hypothetical protein